MNFSESGELISPSRHSSRILAVEGEGVTVQVRV